MVLGARGTALPGAPPLERSRCGRSRQLSKASRGSAPLYLKVGARRLGRPCDGCSAPPCPRQHTGSTPWRRLRSLGRRSTAIVLSVVPEERAESRDIRRGSGVAATALPRGVRATTSPIHGEHVVAWPPIHGRARDGQSGPSCREALVNAADPRRERGRGKGSSPKCPRDHPANTRGAGGEVPSDPQAGNRRSRSNRSRRRTAQSWGMRGGRRGLRDVPSDPRVRKRRPQAIPWCRGARIYARRSAEGASSLWRAGRPAGKPGGGPGGIGVAGGRVDT